MLLLCSITCYAQNFTLNITSTEATCAAGGTLTFSVANEIPGTPITYTVYLLPDIANAVAQTATTTVSDLPPGNYYVTATQNSDGGVVTAIAQEEIEDNSQLAFTIIDTTPLCGDGNLGNGEFTVNVTSGIAATYQITDYPTPLPAQTSPTFSGIEQGYYEITVTDICGNQVLEYAIIAPDIRFQVDALSYSAVYPDCNEIATKLKIVADPMEGRAPIAYPLTVVYTIHPETGDDIVIEQEVASGDPWLLEVEQILPEAIPGEILEVDVLVVYPCGTAQYVGWGMPPGQPDIPVRELTITDETLPAVCGQKFLTIDVRNLVLPYTLVFTQYPEGFDPEAANPSYLSPHTETHLEFGNYNLPVPIGFYKVTVTDACGNSENLLLTVTPSAQVVYTEYNFDCINNLGGLTAKLEGFEVEINLATATLLTAPAEYEAELPLDVTPYINDEHVLELAELPPGTYKLKLADECDNSFEKSILVRSYVPSTMLGETRPDCEPGFATVKITTPNPPLLGMTILNAPDGFPYPLPYDASFNINTDGVFYMDGLPEGDYRFLGRDACYNPDKPRYYSPTITGYQVITNDLQIVPGCDEYDITLNYVSNATDENFWLQKEISVGVWGHPVTGVIYTEGTAPTVDTGVQLTNDETFTAAGWEGSYRILRHHQPFTPVTAYKDCTEEIHHFDLYQGLQLLETNILSCPGAPIDLELITNGASPVTHTIIRKNNVPYLIQNGQNNIFTGLEAATYTIEITDFCSRSITVDIVTQDATPLIVVNDPGTLYSCDVKNDGTDIFTLSLQDEGILGSQDPDEYTVTYHATQDDANAGSAALPNEFISSPTTVYARVIKNDTPGCHGTIAFNLRLYEVPELDMKTPVAFCAGQSVTLNPPPGFISYRWSNGITTPQNTVSTEGLYILTVTNANGCETSQTITVVTSPVPEIAAVDITDFTDNENSITVWIKPTPVPVYPEYSLDGINFQESNVFQNLEPGIYTVFVRDSFGCGLDYETVYLLTYPRYFTPNGDSYNDKWRIKYATAAEPNLMVYIYDRFGKLITGFDSRNTGWDGTLNGAPLPSDDYWFVVKRQNGTEFRGHFALIR
ncbi:T9SS type B sorting domain-containing protein [Flavobacterium sp. RHBU_24]|uniref:T9SS type B sorting domain-containing protein n=1 Tax=Flavobacterium sp. RHBU_24 TaxID=3391185 RepID=UPI00398466D2